MSVKENGSKAKALPFLLVGLGALILFGPMLFRGRVLFWGTPLLQFVPWREFAFDTLLQGNLPLWNSELGMGAPLLANYQTALLYPPNWILPLTGISWGQGLLAMLHLIWAGCGMALLARRMGSGLLGQTMAGLAYGLSGYLVARAGFLSINAAAAWLPWLVLCADRLAEAVANRKHWRVTGKAALLLSVVLAMQWLSGHAQTAWYSLILVGLWAIWRAVAAGGWQALGRLLAWMFAAGVLAFALAGAQLIPTLEYLSDSHRSTMLDPESTMQYSFAPWRSLGLLVPDLFGNPARGDFWGYGNFWEDAIYVGMMPFLFAVLSLVRGISGRDGRKKLIRFLAALSAVVLLLALGKNTPIFPWLFDNVPTFDLFQAPARWNLILTFSLALLAAFGADAWRAPEGRSLYWMRLATAGAAMLALSAWLIGILAPEIEPTFTRSFGLAGIWLFIFCLLALLRPKKLTLLWAGLLGLVVVADLGLTQWGLNPSAAASLYEGPSELANQTTADHRLYMPPHLEYEIKFERTHRFDTFESQIEWEFVRDVGLPNTTLLDGIPSANNFDPLLPERYAVWMQALADLPLDEQESRLALMDVGWRAKEDPESSTGVSYVAVEDPARVRIIYEAIWEQDPGAALDQLLDPAFDPSRSVVLEGIEEHWATAGGTGAILRFEQVNPGHLEIEAASSGNGWLVLSDTWNSGWRATVDEVETEILQADYLFRAIRIPAGEHEIVFRYQPVATLIGFVISGLAWLLVGGMVWLWRRN